MNKIRVIDLLNKIANGEEVPERIKYGTKTWKLRENKNLDNDYINEDLDVSAKLFDEYLDGILLECLNDTVEIIEEQQDIDIQEIEEVGKMLGWALISLEEEIEGQKESINFTLDFFGNKINELIENQNKVLQAVKQLDKNIKDKE